MSTDSSAIAELLRRAQLAKSLNTANGGITQAQNETPPQLSTQAQIDPLAGKLPTQSPNATIPSTALDTAKQNYIQALQTPAPSVSNYHPSIGRRIVAGLLGGIAGMHDPKSGYTVGHGIAYGPYESQLTDYQRELARKKEAYETEEGAEQNEAKLGEVKSQKEAEEKRASAEEARGEAEAGKLRSLQPGTPEYEGELKKLQIQHPNIPKVGTELYSGELKDGNKLEGIQRGADGQFHDNVGNVYGPDAFKPDTLKKIGTEKTPAADKPEREGEAGYIDKLEKKLGRPLTAEEQLQTHNKWEATGRKPEDSGGNADFRKEMQLQQAKVAASRTYQRDYDNATSQIQRIMETADMIDNGSPVAIATTIPKFLTAVVSGQGTGLRINEKEMNRIVKARGWGDSVEAMASRISGHGDLSKDQRQSLKEILYDVRNIVAKQRDIHSKTLDDIDDAEDFNTINKAHKANRKAINEGDTPKKDDKKDPLGILGGN